MSYKLIIVDQDSNQSKLQADHEIDQNQIYDNILWIITKHERKQEKEKEKDKWEVVSCQKKKVE